jgi:hypothetical protein
MFPGPFANCVSGSRPIALSITLNDESRRYPHNSGNALVDGSPSCTGDDGHVSFALRKV